jgi:glutamate 5-kinase
VVDDGAREALLHRGVSLLPAGVVKVSGEFDEGDAVEIAGADGVVFARGLSRYDSPQARSAIGRRSTELADDLPAVLIHRDDLVLLS